MNIQEVVFQHWYKVKALVRLIRHLGIRLNYSTTAIHVVICPRTDVYDIPSFVLAIS